MGNDTRRAYLRSLLSECFSGLSVPLLAPGRTPTDAAGEYATADLGRSRRRAAAMDADQLDNVGVVGSLVDDLTTYFAVRVYLRPGLDADGTGKVDAAIDAAIDELDLAARRYVDGFTLAGYPSAKGDDYSIVVESIRLTEEIPTPNDRDGRAVVTVPGEIQYKQIWNRRNGTS